VERLDQQRFLAPNKNLTVVSGIGRSPMTWYSTGRKVAKACSHILSGSPPWPSCSSPRKPHFLSLPWS